MRQDCLPTGGNAQPRRAASNPYGLGRARAAQRKASSGPCLQAEQGLGNIGQQAESLIREAYARVPLNPGKTRRGFATGPGTRRAKGHRRLKPKPDRLTNKETL